MNILWLINIPLPEAIILMNEKSHPYGGWLINASKNLAEKEDIKLSIAFPHNNTKHFDVYSGEKINFYAFKLIQDKNKKRIIRDVILSEIVQETKPDLVHIFGTELAHTLAMINVCLKENIKTVISIQGLVSVIEKHMYANLPFKVIYGSTLRNILLKDSIANIKKTFYKRGQNEIEAIKNTDHIIGRTTWDKACTLQINSNVEYHFCNETLREEFYKHVWNLDSCEKNTIFLSQGQYSIKGLHYVIEAMPLILDRFPNTKLYISGKNIIKSDTIKDKLLLTKYGKYIKKLIKKFRIESNVIFTGLLDEHEMCERYLRTHVFACPSSIENSPNSLGEAMILGVPCVASNVGGVADMLTHKEDGYVYQADASYMLAYYICEIFQNDNLAQYFSINARKHALNTHNEDNNTRRLIEIYKNI